ncbi:unnamed protein product [Rotaria sp. Silwood1]|nr:unnamed protein product [Rotaria sp. Silwood1]
MKKYGPDITKHSNSWTIAPLMIDSLTAYIVREANSPVKDVYPFKAENPNELEMEFRFECSSEVHATEIQKKIVDDVYGIEVIFHFAGARQVKTNAILVTDEILKAAIKMTIADGGNTNAEYIHRNQGSAFVSKLMTNIKSMSYIEDWSENGLSMFTILQEQFNALLQQALILSAQTKLAINLYNQVWSAQDLNPDRITSEFNKLFTYNKTATENHNQSDQYFDFHKENSQSSSESEGGDFGYMGLSIDAQGATSSSTSNRLSNTTKSVFSLAEIQDLLKQESIEMAWTGEKFIPKSFSVYRLTDITDRLKVHISSLRLLAEKKSGGIVRAVNLRNKPLTASEGYSSQFVGEIKLYSGDASFLPRRWVFCHGQALSRIEYHKLFSVIGESFGTGDGKTTFNVPDFRGRFPLDLNPSEYQLANFKTEGKATQTLTTDQLPSHHHSADRLYTTDAGTHSHTINDPGQNHGGNTKESQHQSYRRSTSPFHKLHRDQRADNDGDRNDLHFRQYVIPMRRTKITLNDDGTYSYSIEGSTGSIGGGNSSGIMPPYQTINYIIFTGD